MNACLSYKEELSELDLRYTYSLYQKKVLLLGCKNTGKTALIKDLKVLFFRRISPTIQISIYYFEIKKIKTDKV